MRGSRQAQTATPGARLTVGADSGAGNVQISKSTAQPGVVDLSLTKTGPADTTPGQVITYTLNYSNLAGASTATGVQITDTLPTPSVDYVPGSCSGSCTVVGDTITWTIGSLAAGASGSRTYQVTAKTSLSSGNDLCQWRTDQQRARRLEFREQHKLGDDHRSRAVHLRNGPERPQRNLLDDDGGAAISWRDGRAVSRLSHRHARRNRQFAGCHRRSGWYGHNEFDWRVDLWRTHAQPHLLRR